MTREQIANIIWSRFDQGNADWIKCDVAAGWILAAIEDEKKRDVVVRPCDYVSMKNNRQGGYMTITYETAKKLKAFLGESAPLTNRYWYVKTINNQIKLTEWACDLGEVLLAPAYSLEDLLSKPFCEAMEKAYEKGGKNNGFNPKDFAHEITNIYYNSGMEAVKRTLIEMMESK